MPFAEWKRRVRIKIEGKHIERIKDEYGGADGEKTKTKHFRRILQDKNFQRITAPIILNRSKIGARECQACYIVKTIITSNTKRKSVILVRLLMTNRTE